MSEGADDFRREPDVDHLQKLGADAPSRASYHGRIEMR